MAVGAKSAPPERSARFVPGRAGHYQR